MRVILVDDDTLVTMSLKTILEADGEIQVVGTGNDGSDAIRLFDELKPDVILMDIQMKEMDGLTASEQIMKKKGALEFFKKQIEIYKNIFDQIKELSIKENWWNYETKVIKKKE